MLELYNDSLIDLLASHQNVKTQLNSAKHSNPNVPEKLIIKKDTKGMVYIQGITLKTVHSRIELENEISSGFQKRRTEETNLNQHSSRSHLVLAVLIQSTNTQTRYDTSPLHC